MSPAGVPAIAAWRRCGRAPLPHAVAASLTSRSMPVSLPPFQQRVRGYEIDEVIESSGERCGEVFPARP